MRVSTAKPKRREIKFVVQCRIRSFTTHSTVKSLVVGCVLTQLLEWLNVELNQSQSQRSFIIFCKVEETKITIKQNKYKGIQMGKNRRRLSRAKSFYLKKKPRGRQQKGKVICSKVCQQYKNNYWICMQLYHFSKELKLIYVSGLGARFFFL